MNEEFGVLALAVSRLESAGIEYMITGSFALAVYATPRMTRDIDVVIDCTADQAALLAGSFQVDSYASADAAREAVASGTMFNVIHNETLLKVDFIVRKQNAFTDEQFSRRRRVDLGEFSAIFISPEDLVLGENAVAAGNRIGATIARRHVRDRHRPGPGSGVSCGLGPKTGSRRGAATTDGTVNDTSTRSAQILAGRYRELTPAERVRMAASMFKVATSLARAGLRSHCPDASEAELRYMLLRRLYDGELTESQFAEIRLAAPP